MSVTLRPRASNSAPMEAAVSPLPRDETTPPVTNTYFVAINHRLSENQGTARRAQGAGNDARGTGMHAGAEGSWQSSRAPPREQAEGGLRARDVVRRVHGDRVRGGGEHMQCHAV